MSHEQVAGRFRVEPPGWAAAYRRVIWAIPASIFLVGLGTVLWALAIDSRQLLKDGLDWAYDVALYGIAAFVFGRGEDAEQATAGLIAAILAVAGFHTLYDLWDKILNPRPIDAFVLGFSAFSAIVVALAIVAALLRFRVIDNPLVMATWLSSRNDAIATFFYSALNFGARALPGARWPEWALDLLAAGLAFQASFAILREIVKRRRAGGDRRRGPVR